MGPGKCLLIVNPAARHGMSGKMLSAVRELASAMLDFDVVVPGGPGEALATARSAIGYDTLVAVGGDGTVHEVLNGIMLRDDRGGRPALGLIPTGSGNDYRRTLGISGDLPTAVRQLADGERRPVDVGLLSTDGPSKAGLYFANSVGIGLDARVTAKAVQLKVTSGWSGLPLYMRALFSVLFRQFHSHEVRLSLDDGPEEARRMLLLAATNGPTYGGGFFITPDSVPDDGLLDVCLLDEVSLLGALWRLPFVVAGKHRSMKPVHMSRHRKIRVRSGKAIEGQVDGEVLLSDSYGVEILPAALDVIVPVP